jgi:hypothetical protein
MNKYISPLEQVYKVITEFFSQELQDGLLSDVNTFITTSNIKDHIEAPIIWLEKESIPAVSISISDSTLIDIPVNLVCCSEIYDDFQTSENNALNLTSRCITSLFKNIIKKRNTLENIKVRGFTINNIDPNGTFEIINKTNRLPATKIELTFHIEINFMLYIDEQGEPVYYGDDDQTIEEINYDVETI